MSRILYFAVALPILVGWIVPLWLAAHMLLTWADGIARGDLQSFPHLHYARRLVDMGCG